MEIKRLVTGAQTGNNKDFDALVHLFYKKVYATIRSVVREDDTAQDLVQETFIKAWLNLRSLKDSSAFPSWLWSIASNLARSGIRAQQHEKSVCNPDPDMDRHADEHATTLPGWIVDGQQQEWDSLVRDLPQHERILAALRYVADLSLREIGAVLDVSEARVKSRLYELRQKMRVKNWNLTKARKPSTPDYPILEEKIMDKLFALRLGAHVFERLSLDIQTQFARAILDNKKLEEAILSAIGKIDRGTEFINLYGSSITLKELIGILNHVDRFTEMRIINHLDTIAPEHAERIKQNMFVFEDIVMLDEAAVRVLVGETQRDILAIALKDTDNKTRNHVLSSLSDERRKGLEKDIADADGGHTIVKSSQEFVINIIKDLEASGNLILLRKSETEITGFTARNP